MSTLFRRADRDRLHRRIDALRADATPRWGRMSAPQMVCHLIDSVESAYDADTEPPGTGPLSRQPLKWLVLHLLPWPKGKMESPARLTQRKPSNWSADVAALHDGIERLAQRDAAAAWPSSEVFGKLTRSDWGALLHAHIHHHLKQFDARA